MPTNENNPVNKFVDKDRIPDCDINEDTEEKESPSSKPFKSISVEEISSAKPKNINP